MNAAMTAQLTLDEAEMILGGLSDRVASLYGRLTLAGETEMAEMVRGLFQTCGDGLVLCAEMRKAANRKHQEFLERQWADMGASRILDDDR